MPRFSGLRPGWLFHESRQDMPVSIRQQASLVAAREIVTRKSCPGKSRPESHPWKRDRHRLVSDRKRRERDRHRHRHGPRPGPGGRPHRPLLVSLAHVTVTGSAEKVTGWWPARVAVVVRCTANRRNGGATVLTWSPPQVAVGAAWSRILARRRSARGAPAPLRRGAARRGAAVRLCVVVVAAAVAVAVAVAVAAAVAVVVVVVGGGGGGVRCGL